LSVNSTISKLTNDKKRAKGGQKTGTRLMHRTFGKGRASKKYTKDTKRKMEKSGRRPGGTRLQSGWGRPTWVCKGAKTTDNQKDKIQTVVYVQKTVYMCSKTRKQGKNRTHVGA